MTSTIFKTVIITILVLSYVVLPAQNHAIDSLQKILPSQKEDTNKVKILTAIGSLYRSQYNHAEAIDFFLKASKVAEQIRDFPGVSKALSEIAITYQQQDDYAEALTYFYKALNFFEQSADKKNMAETFQLIGYINYLQKNYVEALANYDKALSLGKQTGNKKISAWSIRCIADINDVEGNDEGALRGYFSALKIFEELTDSVAIGQTNVAIADFYLKRRNFKKALQRDSMALRTYMELGERGPGWGVALCYNALGDVNEKNGDIDDSIGNKVIAQKHYTEALNNLLISLKLWEQTGLYNGASTLRARLSDVYIKLNKFTEARQYLEKSLEVSKENAAKIDIQNAYESLSYLDSIEGKYQQAYQHYKMYVIYRDSISNEESAKKSLQTKMQYEFDKKEAVAKAEQVKKDIEAKRTKYNQYFIIGGLCILVLAVLSIAFFQWRNNKHKQRANSLLQQQNEKIEYTLSELKSTQAQLIQSEKMASLGELTAGIAHEIQNPLNFVNNFSEVSNELIVEMNDELDKGDIAEAKSIANDIQQNLEKINHHGKRADAIVKGMLQHSQTSTGQKEPTDINKLADEYLRLAYHGLRAKDKSFNVSLKTEYDDSIGNIHIIPQDIRRVLLNLYNNAFYAVAEKGKQTTEDFEPTVSVQTKKSGDNIFISVKDNGNGIPQKIVDKIFQPFFTTKPTGQGTGLGLSLSYDIIKAHGGEIKVETKEGEGTAFNIILPLK